MFKKVRPASNSDTSIKPRNVSFDLSQTPLDWMPNEIFASQLVNSMHLFLPGGEFAFCRIFNKALPLIQDEKLATDVKAFVRQEAMHARSHEDAMESYLQRHGIKTTKFAQQANWIVSDGFFADKPFGISIPKKLENRWLLFRIGLIAALEHTTCVLGNYALTSTDNWNKPGVDPELVDLLRWHGAEEIEHRCVAFDLYTHLGGSYPTRYYLKLLQLPVLMGLLSAGTCSILNQIPDYPGSKHRAYKPHTWLAWRRSAKLGLAPSMGWLLKHELRYLLPWYNPLTEANTQDALDYLQNSTGVARTNA